MAMAPFWEIEPHPGATEHEGPGSFRRHDIHPFPAGVTPPSWVLIEAALDDWLREVNGLPARSPDFAERLAEQHCRFERIHPFLDGNERAGRLLLNLVLVRLGSPPAVIDKRQRAAYLRALRRADGGEPGSLGELIARAILDNLYKFVLPALAGPARLVPLASLTVPGVSADALRVAAARGRLQATPGPDGHWRSCRNWVEEYVDCRSRRPGPA
jgi:hypothetical protein